MPNTPALGRLQSQLRELQTRASARKAAAGRQHSLRAAADEVGKARGVPLASQRVSEWLGRGPRSSAPRDADLFLALVEVWTVWAGEVFDRESRLAWLRLLEDAQDRPTTDAGGKRLGRAVAKLSNALDYEVLPAISSLARDPEHAERTVLPPTPAYILRAVDGVLRAALSNPQRSKIVCVVGAPASGKTRACWEAVHQELSAWHLWHPLVPSPARGLLDGLRSERLTRATVLWLNEAVDYLTGPKAEEVAAALREALRAPALQPLIVLCTLRPDTYKALTSASSANPGQDADARPPSHVPQVAQLLSTAQMVFMPDSFPEEQIQQLRLLAPEDQRVAEAVFLAPEGRLTQYLTGTQALLDRYITASAPERAVLESAMDLCRLGMVPALPALLLRETADTLLRQEDRLILDGDWFERAVTELLLPRRGLPGPLHRSLPARFEQGSDLDCYALAESLQRHGETSRVFHVPPAAWWEAAARTAEMPRSLLLGDAAQVRGRFCHASQLYGRAADSGTALALLGPASLAEARKEWQDAQQHAAAFRAAGGAEALEREILAYEEDGQIFIAQVLQDRTEGFFGDSDALSNGIAAHLVQGFHLEATDGPAAKGFYRRQYEQTREPMALYQLALLHQADDDLATAKELLLKAAQEGVPCYSDLADLFETVGDEQMAVRYRNAAAADGDLIAIEDLADLYHRAGSPDWAEECLLEAARLGAWWLWLLAAEWRMEAGEPDEAERLLERAVEEDSHLLGYMDLGDIRERRGRFDSALTSYRTAQQLGLEGGLARQVSLLEKIGRSQEATRIVDEARTQNDLKGLDGVMRHYLQNDRLDEAETLCLTLERYTPEAAVVRADIAWRRGDSKTALVLLTQSAKAGDVGAVERLMWYYGELDEWVQFEAACRQLLDAGAGDALRELEDLLRDRGRGREAEATRRWGLDAQGRVAAPWGDTLRP
ncbi:hypothetical protein OID55_42155 (plasmid) [Streptomyces sp. NBC_00715]|uniref:tetratricopeptide repeat protein n=1 Tax=Streptomyces sp. NBC_00715 TaxID=2975811 RepID=UPI00386C40A9